MMSPHRAKQLAAGLLVLAVPAIWVPQILEQLGAPPAAEPEPADESIDEDRPTTSPGGAAVPDASSTTTTPGAAPRYGEDVLADLGEMLRVLRGTPQAAAAESEARQREGEAAIVARAPALEAPDTTDSLPTVREASTDAGLTERIDAFLDGRTLRGTLVGHDGTGRALWGGRLVRPGDSFVDGAIRVEEIRDGELRVRVAGEPVDYGLPEFETRRSDALELEEGSDAPADDPDPSAAARTAPADAPTVEDLDTLGGDR